MAMVLEVASEEVGAQKRGRRRGQVQAVFIGPSETGRFFAKSPLSWLQPLQPLLLLPMQVTLELAEDGEFLPPLIKVVRDALLRLL